MSRRLRSLAGVALLFVPGCSQPAGTPPAGSQGSGSPTASASAEPTNPVYPLDFPDPQVLPDGKDFVAIATNGNGMNVQTLTSPDLATWQQGQDVLPQVAPWSSSGKVWAPEIIRWTDGTYHLVYSTKAPDPTWQCVSVATSKQLRGPYVDQSKEPLVCETKEGGSIDASPFIDDDGAAYLYWKNDGNAIGVDTYIKAAKLSADGLRVAGPVAKLFKQDLPWEGNLVEAPAVVKVDGVYHLFYSANDYASDRYAVGHATSRSATGPFVKDPDPVLSTNEVAAGPGHCQLFQVDGQWWMVYHAWPPDAVGDSAEGRKMWLSQVRFDGTSVHVDPPATDLDTD